MYSLKVRGATKSAAPPGEGQAAATAAGSTSDGQDNADTAIQSAVDQLDFSAGNPRVEHITGIVHLYRHLSEDGGATTDQHRRDRDGGPTEPPPLPAERSEQLCVLSLPPDMGFPEFCTFLGAYFERAKDIRLVRRNSAAKATCLVLLQFDAQEAADGFYTDFNGKPFCVLEPEFVCRLLFVKDVEFSEPPTAQPGSTTTTAADADAHLLGPAPSPPPGATELPSCPVCLERLDEHISGVVTTVCNHKFHNRCLRQWGDSTCPVCRYCQHPSEGASHCGECGTAADLWICLICGHVGCGRYRGSHASTHWQESGHGYALELETQRVWDYASDAYVHRLVRSKTDGKLVEVPAPGSSGRSSGGGNGRGGGGEGCSGGSGVCGGGGGGEPGGGALEPMDPHLEEALVASKLDALASEYSHLLVSQLDSQRAHFEGLLEKQRQELEAAVGAAEERAAAAAAAAEEAAVSVAEERRRRRTAESKLGEIAKAVAKVREEKEFLKELNDTLLANQKQFKVKLEAAEGRATEQEATVRDLQEQVRDLMVFIQARDTIDANGGGEVAGATVLPLPPQSPPRRQRKKK